MNVAEAKMLHAQLERSKRALAEIGQKLGVSVADELVYEHVCDDWIGRITAAIHAKLTLVYPSGAARRGLLALSDASAQLDIQAALAWITSTSRFL